VSVPTGSGKTAIAAAAPYIAQAGRVLVVVPSKDLRQQIAETFESQLILREIGVLSGDGTPSVMQVTGRVDSWAELHRADVVVAIPNSISPAYYPTNPAPQDLFDLLIVDEAHHAPAPTWQAILDHFTPSLGLLLTATPQRRDGRRVPGDMVYHYPLRQALDDGIYKPVHPVVLDVPAGATKADVDELIVGEVAQLATSPEHATSTVLIRAASIARAQVLAEMYCGAGVPTEVMSSRTPLAVRADMVERLRAGELHAVAVVDMLGEGIDLPSLRIAAYHDKHKSLNATVQLIGRLVRVDARFPQPSVLVAARDIDVYPQLQGAVRSLWEEDADWAAVLPGLIDDQVAESIASRDYAAQLPPAPPEVAVEAIQPVVRGILYEVHEEAWQPGFASGAVPDGLIEGQRLRGQTVIYSACTPSKATLAVLTGAVARPRWHAHPGLDSMSYDLHLVTWQPATQRGQPDLVIVNSADGAIARALLESIDAHERVRPADPARMQDAFDSLQRISVSNVGVRNTYLGTRGVPTYRTFAGKSVERGLRDADTARGALGHAMAQVADGTSAFTAGVATGKGKFWETRYVPLREYEDHLANYASRYWFPPGGGPGPLLPNVARGERLSEFPMRDIAAIEMNVALYGMGWQLLGGDTIDELDLQPDPARSPTPNLLPLRAIDPAAPDVPVWEGDQDTLGNFIDRTPLQVQRGFGTRPFSDLLADRPPSIYYLDGNTVVGPVLYRRRAPARDLPDLPYITLDWTDVNRTAETRGTAKDKDAGISIHEALENWLRAKPKRRRHRWIFCNDGAREIADYLVLEIDPGFQVSLSLWHAKAAGGPTASIRITDMQVVTAQAIKSRRWATDRTLWSELAARLSGRTGPPLTIVSGSRTLLRVLLGEDGRHPAYWLTTRAPIVECEVGIAQPGLSLKGLQNDLASDTPSIPAQQIRELLTVWHDAVALIGTPVLLSGI